MTGSIALDVVIGLIFIYLLYSLFATILCEIVAVHLGLRERNLKRAVQRMLEDVPQTSETKIVALYKQVKRSITGMLFNQDGPATCVFYHLPVIKYLAQNSFQSKPAYITKHTFSKAIFEIFQRYGGSDELNDLHKIQNVLQGKVEHTEALKSLKDAIIINPATQQTYQPGEIRDYNAIYTSLKEKVKANDFALAEMDAAQRKILEKISAALSKKTKTENDKKVIVYKVDEMLNLFGYETRSHLASLLRDSGNDLLKFRLHIEQWFEDTMERASGWYKQKIQFVLLIIGLIIAICFNANTITIVSKLSVDKDIRDKMIERATQALNDPKIKLVVDEIRDDGSIDTVTTEVKNRKAKLDSLNALQREVRQQLEDANTLLGSGWITIPDSLSLHKWTSTAEDSLRKLKAKRMLDYAVIYINNEKHKKLLVFPNGATSGILSCLYELDHEGDDEVFTGTNKAVTTIAVDNSFSGYVLYLLSNIFSTAFWGYLLTAIAISLGAPFWFDLLNKLIQVRGVIKQRAQSHAGNAAVETGNVSDPSHPLNRKG